MLAIHLPLPIKLLKRIRYCCKYYYKRKYTTNTSLYTLRRFLLPKVCNSNVVFSFSTLVLFFSCVVCAQEGQVETLDTINLGTTVQGNKELPKILYIIPWATPPGPGQVDPLVPHSANVFERTFTPLERLEQQRRLRYYNGQLASP